MATNQERGRSRRKYDKVLLDAGYTEAQVEEYYRRKNEYNKQYRHSKKQKADEEAKKKDVLRSARYFLRDAESAK